MNRIPAPLCLLPLAIALNACAIEPDDVCMSDRMVTANKLAANLIAANGLLGEMLPEVPLTTAAIGDAFEPADLADAFTQSVLEYTVSCALAPEQSIDVAIDGERRTFDGAMGLAPQWGTTDGVCDATCQGWVSACLIARTNFLGESVQISLLGDHPGLEPTAEESLVFDAEEATYYGDLFSATKTMYACLPAGATTAVRTCGDDPASCPITVVGACDDLCDTAGCRNAEGVSFAETITVNIRETPASCG